MGLFKGAKDGQIKKADAVELLGGSYYCNESKHVGDVLSRMVKAGLLTRVKKGVFEIGKGKKAAAEITPENQTTLFNDL